MNELKNRFFNEIFFKFYFCNGGSTTIVLYLSLFWGFWLMGVLFPFFLLCVVGCLCVCPACGSGTVWTGVSPAKGCLFPIMSQPRECPNFGLGIVWDTLRAATVVVKYKILFFVSFISSATKLPQISTHSWNNLL